MTVKQYKTIKKAPLAWCVMIVVVQALQKNYLVELFSRNEFPILCCFLSSVAVFDINLPFLPPTTPPLWYFLMNVQQEAQTVFKLLHMGFFRANIM